MPLSAIDTPLVSHWVGSSNYDGRAGGCGPDMLILHYTGMDSHDGARTWLASPDSKVSSHYIVDEDGTITQMVAERERAWHAGVSCWDGETDINSRSIGIEIHNPGHSVSPLPPYPEAQMKAVTLLTLDICARNRIPARRVLGHSDVAPHRKTDPGEHFDWARLYRKGVGIWVPPAPADMAGMSLTPGDAGPPVAKLRSDLIRLGYGLATGDHFDNDLRGVVTAFQRHWRPARVDGIADPSTVETLARLLANVDAHGLS